MNFEIIHEIVYGDYKNKDGSEFFKDMREHKSAKVVVLDLMKQEIYYCVPYCKFQIFVTNKKV